MDQYTAIQAEVEALLRQKIGLNPESVGCRSILRAVKKGVRASKNQALSYYLLGLQTSSALFESLVESVVVPETSFFRNRASFVFLRQWVGQDWPQTKLINRPLRVLSMPCSTGEEPYSIAISLLEEKLSLAEFHIDAVDISAVAIAKAKSGVYSPYAFRRQTYRSDDKYFTLGMPTKHVAAALSDQPMRDSAKRAVPQRYCLLDSIREKIAFRAGNVLDPQLLADQPLYDIVFCRNLLIYFDQPARDRTLALINRLLRPGRLLFVGYAETGLIDSKLYKPVPYPQTFAYYKQIDSPVTTAQTQLAVSKSVAEAVPKQKNALISETTFPDLPAVHQPSLSTAQYLADSGQISQAILECDRCLALNPTIALAHLLRGELYQATGDETAAQACFEKALYLDPQLSEALTHLLLIKEAQ